MTELRFDGQVAVVTGAGRGLGRTHALLLAARGARVVVNDIGSSVTGEGNSGNAAADVVAEIRALGGDAIGNADDIGDPDGGRALIDAAVDAFGGVDIVVNNAGIIRNAPFEETSPDLLEPLLRVHVAGAFHVTRPAWTLMRAKGYGRIVNTTSAAGLLGADTMSNYGAAKGGILGLTRVLANEGRPLGIRVNAVAPTGTTRMLEACLDLAEDGPARDEEAAAMMAELRASVLSRLDPALVSPVVAFLAHRDCPVTGEVYTAGGGQVSRFFLGRTRGVFDPALSVEDVRDRFADIRDENGYTVPADPGEEMAEVFGRLMSS